MTKKVYKKVNLTCIFQDGDNDGQPAVVSGMLSPTDGGMLFQETLPRRRASRNARLYEGTQVSVVRRKDGFYYPLLKSIRPMELKDKESLVFKIYCELTEALDSIE